LRWWNCGLVTQYKKFVLKNVKFHHIIKFPKVPEFFPNPIVRTEQLWRKPGDFRFYSGEGGD